MNASGWGVTASAGREERYATGAEQAKTKHRPLDQSLPGCEISAPVCGGAISNQKVLHTGQQQYQEHDRKLREPQEPAIGVVVLRVVHGGMAVRFVDTHGLISPVKIGDFSVFGTARPRPHQAIKAATCSQ
jgi:hypothetical protein